MDVKTRYQAPSRMGGILYSKRRLRGDTVIETGNLGPQGRQRADVRGFSGQTEPRQILLVNAGGRLDYKYASRARPSSPSRRFEFRPRSRIRAAGARVDVKCVRDVVVIAQYGTLHTLPDSARAVGPWPRADRVR